MSSNTNLSARQRMINLMYIVLTAMLALNVSSDVLVGFEMVGDSMTRSISNAQLQNRTIMDEIADFNKTNPEKAGEWYDKASQIHKQAHQLYQLVEELKIKMVKYADGENGDIHNIRNYDDLEASSFVMLAPGSGRGKELYDMVVGFRTMAASMIDDSHKRAMVERNLSTDIPPRSKGSGKNWQEAMFESMPLIAATTILTKLQNDVLYAESEILHLLSTNIDKKDVRVNQLNAYVIPTTKNVIAGGKYSANIVLAAIDSTQHPDIYIGNERLSPSNNGYYEVITGREGNYTLDGYVQVNRGDGSSVRYPFSDEYTVVQPSATVSATMMNLLYMGIDNPVSISVPGVANQYVSATMTNGTLSRGNNGNWIAKPVKADVDAEITVSATIEGRTQVVNKSRFRVRPLPPPLPFVEYKETSGAAQRYKGGRGLSKALLLEAEGIGAAIDDDILNISFRVLGFETVFFDSMGNAIPEVSNGSKFSARQKESFRRMSRGKRFYISRVKAIGPDGIERTLTSSLEVIVQ